MQFVFFIRKFVLFNLLPACIAISAIVVSHNLLSNVIRDSFLNRYTPDENSKFKILLVWGNGIGEQEQTYRFKIASERLGIDLRSISTQPQNILHRLYFRDDWPQAAAAVFRPNLILTIERNIKPIPGAPNYLVLDQSKYSYMHEMEGFKSLYNRNLLNFTGLLPTFPEIDDLRLALKDNQSIFYGFKWYPTIYATKYKVNTAKKLFYPGGILKDLTRSSEKYKKIFSILDQTGYLEVYGPKRKWRHAPNSIHPPIPFDGISLLTTQNAAGISLILHDEEHLTGNVPSGRIFEAAAANTVIITDKLEFIQKNFGDSVLYIDVAQSAESIAAQIDQHVKWVFSNPQESRVMAERCHDIFMAKFTLEDQLRELIALNSSIAKNGTITNAN